MTADPVTQAQPEYRLIPHALITANLKNVRRTIEVTYKLEQLATSIATIGVQEPLLVHEHPDDPDRFVIIAGHRRHRAAGTLADPPDMPCMVHPPFDSRAALVAAMVNENGHREDLSPIEEAEAYEEMRLDGLDDRAIAGMVSFPPKRVTGRRKLLKLPEQQREQLHRGQFTLDQAQALLQFAGDREATTELTHALNAGDDGAWRWALKKAQDRAARTAAAAKAVKELQKTGARVVTNSDLPDGWRPGMYPDWWRLQHHPANGLPESREAHDLSDCDQLVVVLSQGDFPIWYCLDPSRHGLPTPADRIASTPAGPQSSNGATAVAQADETPEARAEREAEDARRQQDNEDAQTAASLRRDYLTALIGGAANITTEMAEAIASFTAEEVTIRYCEATPDQVLTWLPPNADLDDEDDEQVTRYLRTFTGHQALLAALAAENEDRTDQPGRWEPNHISSRRGWLNLLGGPLGYEWSAWELGKLEAASPASDTEATEQ